MYRAKQMAFESGDFKFPAPLVYTGNWNEQTWLQYIEVYGVFYRLDYYRRVVNQEYMYETADYLDWIDYVVDLMEGHHRPLMEG